MWCARFSGFLVVALLLQALAGSEMLDPLRRGHLRELTDATTGEYRILSFAMSADASRVVYYVQQTVLDERECYAYQLRLLELETGTDTLVEQGFTYDTGVGYGCANSLNDGLSISNDGGTICYFRLRSPAEPVPELVVYDVDTQAKEVLLQSLPYFSYGESSLRNVDPYVSRQLIALSGDGTAVFFINRFGPYGPQSSGSPYVPSGFTLYRVATDGSGATPLYSDSDLRNTAGVGVNALYIVAGGGYLATNDTGSLVLFVAGGSFPSANQPHHLLAITPAVGPTSAEVLLDLAGYSFSGPTLSGDGTVMAYARSGGALPELRGLFTRSVDGSPPEVLVDGQLNWTANPQLSKDGQALVYNVDEGGGSSPSLRYALADGSIHVPLNRPVSRVRYDYGALSSDGAIVTYVGKVEGASGFEPFGEPNLVAMTWGSDAPPVITNVTALPEATMLRQPSSNAEHATNQQFYTVSGSSLLAMYTLPYDPATAIPPPGYGGFHEYGGILDDGLFDGLDAIAGDGIFSDNYQAIFSNMPADPLMIRAGVTASDGTASFVDVAVPVRDKIPVTAGFNMWPTVGVAPLNVSFQDTSVGDYLELRWSFVSVFTIDRVGAPGDAPAFVYADAGTYTPILVATGRGSTNEFRRTAGIRVYGSMAEMAKELAEDFEGADGDASGGLDLDEAATLIPLLDEARLTAWDKDEDQQLSRRELLEGVGGEGVVHTGDPDADYQVTLSELLRVIQFFNIGGYHCEAGTEDQYGTGAGDQGCTPHSSDYLPADWAINLSELLRFIQFFNSGGYVPDPDGEDGFRAGS